jgi:cell division protein FtsQ
MPRLTAGWLRAGAITGVAMVLALGALWLYHSPALTVRDVTVKGNATLPRETVLAAADLEGESILLTDFGAASDRVRELPMVKDVRIERDFPVGAKITVIERTPWGVWQVNGQRYTIDDEGVVLEMPAPEGAAVIAQTDTAETLPRPGDRLDAGALDVARLLVPTAEQTLGRRVVALEFSQAAGITVVLAGDIRVTFGDAEGYAFKVAALHGVLQRAQEQGRQVRHVDLRFGDRVAVQ